MPPFRGRRGQPQGYEERQFRSTRATLQEAASRSPSGMPKRGDNGREPDCGHRQKISSVIRVKTNVLLGSEI